MHLRKLEGPDLGTFARIKDCFGSSVKHNLYNTIYNHPRIIQSHLKNQIRSLANIRIITQEPIIILPKY